MADYLIGRGPLRVAKRDSSGFPLALFNVGEVPMIEIQPTVQYADNFETNSAFARQDLHTPVRTGLEVNVRFKEKQADNLVIYFGGEKVTIPATPVVDLAWPTGILIGEERLLPDLAVNVGSFSIKDSAGSPVTLTSGTHYVVDLKYGRVTFGPSAISGFTQPFKASYTPVAGTSIPFLVFPGEEYFIDAEVLDISKRPNQRFKVQIYRAVFDLTPIPLKGEEVAEFSTKLTCLDDPLKPETTGLPFGRYGRWYPIG